MSVVTMKVIQYCQNSCGYCVAKSNAERWRPVPFMVAKNILDVPSALDWIDANRPEADIHISGGEPLLRPDIASILKSCVATGRRVVIFTNGQLLPQRPELWEIPGVHWLVTWHQDSVTLDRFLECVSYLRHPDRVEVHTILYRDAHEMAIDYVRDKFSYFARFRFRYADQTARTWDAWKLSDRPIERPASDYLTLIEEDGSIYPCNTKYWGPIGSVYDPDGVDHCKAAALDAHAAQCFVDHRCGAHLTARILEEVP
jgi:hypothetical protein